MSDRLPRSYLFVPGSRPDRFAKAFDAGADAVIIDLEDAVPPAGKAAAREHVARELTASHAAYVRINGPDTEWFADDILCLARHPGVAGIVLPKAEGVEHVEAVLQLAHPSLVMLPLVETALGVWHMEQLARAPRVTRLVFGSLDLQLDLGLADDHEALLAFRSKLVLVSRVAGIAPPVDGVTTSLDDDHAVLTDAQRAYRMGFRGKLCIHPKQINPVHRAFSLTLDERAWAQRVLDAVAASGGAAVSLDGKMVDLPVIRKARAIASSFDA